MNNTPRPDTTQVGSFDAQKHDAESSISGALTRADWEARYDAEQIVRTDALATAKPCMWCRRRRLLWCDGEGMAVACPCGAQGPEAATPFDAVRIWNDGPRYPRAGTRNGQRKAA